MLDFNINVELKPNVVHVEPGTDCLLLTSCTIHSFDDNRIWSAFDEMCYNDLNSNDYGFGAIDFEIGFSGYKGKSYPALYTKCFALRTDNDLLIKPMKFKNNKSHSKINQRGETVIGIRYYLRTEREIEKLKNCGRLMFESFFALDKPKNTYAFMCQLCKKDEGWEVEAANTYRCKDNENIKWLID
jgi:hypothetical protein